MPASLVTLVPTGDERAALPALVGAALGDDDLAVVVGRACPRCGSSAHGRPVVVEPQRLGLHVSIARAGGHTLLAVAPSPVGVDVERRDAAALAVGALPGEGRLDPTRAWVRYESVAKLDGRGVRLAGDELRRVATRVDVVDLHLDAALVAAVAVPTGAAAPLMARRGPGGRFRSATRP